MRDIITPRPAEREGKSRRPYVAPAFQAETVFETMALRCSKTDDGGGGPGGGGRGGRGGDVGGGRGGSGGGDRLPMRRRRLGCDSYYNRKNS